jgi:methylthioxylose transferase
MLGLPTAAWWLAAGARRPLAVAGLAVVAIAAALGFTKGETERIWLPFVPLACAGAAALVPPGRLRPVLALLAVQALATEVAFSTIW